MAQDGSPTVARRRERPMKANDPWWVSTKDFLPDEGEKVLIITKFGIVTDASLRTYLPTGRQRIWPVLFSPDAYKPNEDVKWWMPIPEDGWHDIKSETPREGDIALTMGMYGRIFSGVWKRPCGATESMFMPYVWDVLFWRPMPPLPPGVNLKQRYCCPPEGEEDT